MRYVLVSLITLLSLAAAQEEPVNAVATIAMIGDVVENVGAECVAVTNLMEAGVDPHLYQASAGDVQTFQTADVIFYSGYVLEGQLGDVLESFTEQKPTVAVSPASIDPSDLITVQDIYGIDPHVWMDVSLWAKIAPTIADTLAELRPDCAEQMQTNAESYTEQLMALHAWVQESVATIPEPQRVLVTAHDAFAYYGRAYGIEVAAIQGISTEAEAAVADIRETVETVVERQVPAIFVESTINPRTIESVQQAAREQGQEVEVGGELYSDAMGAADTAGGTYIGMLYENTVTLTEALGGAVPPLPNALAEWAEQWSIQTSAN